MTIHILVTVRRKELLGSGLLVFKSLRVGFPVGEVCVWGNGLGEEFCGVVAGAARSVGGTFRNLPAVAGVAHDAWLEGLIQGSLGPFWIVDTDVHFWGPMPGCGPEVVLAGRWEPEFREPWTGAWRVERLQTCCMFIEPAGLRGAMRRVMARVPEMMRPSAEFPLVRQAFVGRRERGEGRTEKTETLFYDTGAGLWQAGIGTPLTAEQDGCFEHLYGGTYADLLGPAIGMPAYAEGQALMCAAPAGLRGLREKQREWMEGRGRGKVEGVGVEG